jgi:hypothetical protein
VQPQAPTGHWPDDAPDRYISVVAEGAGDRWQQDCTDARTSSALEDDDVPTDATIPPDS